MTKKIAVKEMAAIREMLLSNAIHVETLVQLLVEKGVFTSEEYVTTLKKAQADFQRRAKQETLKKSAIKV